MTGSAVRHPVTVQPQFMWGESSLRPPSLPAVAARMGAGPPASVVGASGSSAREVSLL